MNQLPAPTDSVREVEGELLTEDEARRLDLMQALDDIQRRNLEDVERHLARLQELRKQQHTLEYEVTTPVLVIGIGIVIGLLWQAGAMLLRLAGH
ncbi:hypothetical protein D3C85_923060 [compost metagenome]